MKIHAYDRTIAQIFNSEVKYIIPRFQREYSWTKDEISEFWSDIIDNIEETEQGFVNKEYFIGSLVLVEESEYAYHVVDGQQRLTTITVLFSALIETFLKNNNEGLANGLYNFVEGRDLNADRFFKLVNENPRPFFQKAIQNLKKEELKPSSKEEQRINEAYSYFFEKLNSLKSNYSTLEAHIEFLKAIRNQILSLKTIFISVNDMDEAYTIFETLNSKGISLTTTDLIKNDIFKVLNYEHPIDDAKESWKTILSNTKSSHKDTSINTFIRHYWLSKYEFITHNRLYKAYKKQQINDVENMKAFLNELLAESYVYKMISSPDMSDWKQHEEKQIYFSLEALNIFKVTQLKTILLSLIAQRKKGIVSVTQLKSAIRMLENFHFIFTAISSDRAAGLEGKYSTIARKIRSAKKKTEINDALKELNDYLIDKKPNYEKFERGFMKLEFTNNNTSDKKLIQYILKKFEEKRHTTEELFIGNISLEHIVPQADGTKGLELIGNLLPIDQKLNQKADRKSFKDKLVVFSDSDLKLIQEFISDYNIKDEWTTEDIIQRTKKMAKEAFEEIWTI
ncbi:hypothetical protein COM99_26435 [Bacillus cereus]|uniref:DUF262 domain-containing protein n=1 Tax=Bacillus cereus TaxID=1396 RepID=UPI000BEB5922|nr:DUF262 domain-containing protein [Bacillus cereus]MDF3554660.1 DUF262 domain-containing HNH endonuclease family protein [Bacillus cereus]PEC30698.1 hypothetical protein COM99_26435 [Bacillus cereus]PEY41082.1 hypothetical protein CN347_01855 [Bacillus cereus]PFJ73691.1 hypothetical protein COJ08_24125 [Bacillus cereus]PFP18920.1 hypothetical protein COJ94_29050 [Bacillus cereus]